MSYLGQSRESGESSVRRRGDQLLKLLKPRKLWSKLQESYQLWCHRHAWLAFPYPPAHAKPQAAGKAPPDFRAQDRAWAMPASTHHRPRLRMRPRRMHLVRTGRGIGLEALEPRLLLSADLSYTAMGSGDFTLRLDEVDGVATVRLVDSADAQVIFASAALADIDGSSGAGVRVVSSDYDVRLTLDASLLTVDVAGGIEFLGGAGDDSLFGAAVDSLWTLTGDGIGTLGDGLTDYLRFSALDHLIGAADNQDTFRVQAGGALSGTMDGGAGGFDTMLLDGGHFQNVSYGASGPQSGYVDRDGQRLNYEGLEPIVDNSTADNVSLSTNQLNDSLPVPLPDNLADEATLTDNGDGTLSFASVSAIPTFESIRFNKPVQTLTIRLGGDPGLPLFNQDTLTVTGVDLGTATLTIDGEDGRDAVVFNGNVSAGAITVLAESIDVNGSLSVAGDLVLTASASGDGTVPLASQYLGFYLANDASALIDLSGATVSAGGAITLSATATANVIADPADLGPVAVAGVAAVPKAQIVVNSAVLSAASLSASANVSATVNVVDAADASDNSATLDAAVSIVYLETVSSVHLGGSTSVQVSGAVSLAATTVASVTSAADGTQGQAGATLGLTIVDLSTEALVQDSASIGALAGDAPDSITISAALGSAISTSATSTAGGASDGGGSNQSEQRLQDPNQDSNTSDQAATSGGGINFAGAVAMSFYDASTTAAITSTGSIATGGALALTAASTESLSTTADGRNTGAGNTGVGVAVAFGLTNSHTTASIGGASVNAGSVSLGATLAAGNSYTISATSGAGDASEFGLAGSLAIQVLSTTVQAEVLSSATLTLGDTSDLSLSASSTTAATTSALPGDSGAAGLGIGASVAVNVIDHSTRAELAGAVDGGHDVTLAASGTHTSATTAQAGGKGNGLRRGG